VTECGAERRIGTSVPVKTLFPVDLLLDTMDCFRCEARIDRDTEHFELHHYQDDSDPIRQHTFCSTDCLREYLQSNAEE
jgi:hypothetical protein